jgi:hypothetical protein
MAHAEFVHETEDFNTKGDFFAAKEGRHSMTLREIIYFRSVRKFST